MENQIFRQKSVARIASPEQLSDYVRVSTPGIWFSLAAMLVLLVGVCIWGVLGRLVSTVPTAVVVRDGMAVCSVRESDIAQVQAGQQVRINDGVYALEGVSAFPVPATGSFNAYARHITELSEDAWVYEGHLNVPLPDGVYLGKIVTQSLHPIAFLLN